MNPHAGNLERRIRDAEKRTFAAVGVEVDEDFLELERARLRIRVLAHGSGPPVLLLHGGALSAVAWAPLFPKLPHLRLLAVDLPGRGLSDPFLVRRGQVREQARRLLDDVIDAVGLDELPVIGHSLGGMLALWHVAAGSDRISGLIAIGEPAVALPGTRVRMPLSLLTVRGIGFAALRSPSPRRVYRRRFSHGMGAAEIAAAPGSLIEALRLSARRPENARSVASLMHAINRFRHPRPESVLTSPELAAIRTSTIFVLGSDDPYLSVQRARPSIEQIQGATLYEVPAGHGPWLVDPEHVARLVAPHPAFGQREALRSSRDAPGFSSHSRTRANVGHVPEWDAEIEVDEALARRLIRESYPHLRVESLHTLGIGWDNTVWATADGVAFRFPRRKIALAGITREMRLLPQIAPYLPRAIPDAAYPGSPSPLFPWPWFGSRVIDGREIPQRGLDDLARDRLAEDLGAFLRCLHGLSPPGLDALPIDPMGRASMSIRVPRTRAALDELDPCGALTDRAEAILTMADALPETDDFVLAHGDLHVRHALVDEVGRLTGVIDWGDICRAPASVDLSLFWSVFPPAARERFVAAYGNVDDATLLRARVLALFLSATLALYARARGMPALEAEALSGVERTLTD